MSRLAVSAFAIGLLTAASPVVAADYFPNSSPLRAGYGTAWDNSDADDPLSFELGLRYWYSWGAQRFNVGGSGLSDDDNAQSVEGAFRIDDASTNFYAKGLVGTSFDINGTEQGGTYGTTQVNGVSVTDGRISYAGADLGYSWLGNNPNLKFGPFAGYMYWNDSPNIGRANYNTSPTAGDSQENDVAVNALRLGLSGKTNLGNSFDVSGELAAVPYAKINGTLGAFGVASSTSGGTTTEQGSPADIDGWGYGAMGEVMVGYHPTSSMVFRVGARAWYLQGRADSSYDMIKVDGSGNQTGSQRYISTSNPWSLFRYGLLTELSYTF